MDGGLKRFHWPCVGNYEADREAEESRQSLGTTEGEPYIDSELLGWVEGECHEEIDE